MWTCYYCLYQESPAILNGKIFKYKEARASSGRAGPRGGTTGHATGYTTGSGACKLLLKYLPDVLSWEFCSQVLVLGSLSLDVLSWAFCSGFSFLDSCFRVFCLRYFVLRSSFLDLYFGYFVLGILFLDYYSWRSCPGFCAYWALRALGVIGTGNPGSIKGFFASKAGCFKDVSGRGSMREVKE